VSAVAADETGRVERPRFNAVLVGGPTPFYVSVRRPVDGISDIVEHLGLTYQRTAERTAGGWLVYARTRDAGARSPPIGGKKRAGKSRSERGSVA
jgi:hypothetical protein